uniref:Uncharacterized LOC107382281 n=1 Tax=Nothobranchius furzeri TaxID=105023 RepID=A0A8C6PY82_NOTFU
MLKVTQKTNQSRDSGEPRLCLGASYGQKGDGSAFFALRSCHQLLQGDGGEFFSPDYLCSNPPLWCNWTIQVDPGKRIHLRLEDLTPDETCELKQDQIHIDEPAGHSGGHKVLQKCWQEAKYTSSSNTLYVVLLIGGWPRPTYRGFYGRYQAFGQPVVYNPKEGFTGRSKESKLSSGLMDFSDFDSAVNRNVCTWSVCKYTRPTIRSLLVFVFRLNAGALYILWLKIGQGPGGVQIHRAVHSAMQGLLTPGVSLQASDKNAVIMSVSTADVNECGTQLVMCDFNADCVNQFGTYSCHCRPGFQDESRVGSGGTVCMESQDAGCTSGLTSESKGVYVLFFLLSFLILTLMVVAGTLYHRHHRGTFLVRCNSRDSISPPDPNNNHHLHSDDSYSTPTECDLPPPPPARGIREGWVPVKEHCPSMDLTLLRFNSLLPPDGYIDPKDKGKM